jgi:hypothetical protein
MAANKRGKDVKIRISGGRCSYGERDGGGSADPQNPDSVREQVKEGMMRIAAGAA